MKKTVLIFVAFLLIALSATSQPYRWLPINVAVEPCGYVIDSSEIYAIAENKRLAVDCFEDAYLRDSIICQQETEIAMQSKVYERIINQNAVLESTVHAQAKELISEKPKKWRWGAIGFGLGFLLKALL